MRRRSARPWIGIFCGAAIGLAGALPATLDREAAEDVAEATARSSGGDFTLSSPRLVAPAPHGGDFELRPIATDGGPLAPTGSLCFCADILFSDGFESGNTGAWDATGP